MYQAPILCLGGANLDIKCRLSGTANGSSDPADIRMSPGGVARNVAHNLALLGHSISLVTVLANDSFATLIKENAPEKLSFDQAITIDEGRSGVYCAILDQCGELIQAASDMNILSELTPERLDAIPLSLFSFIFAECNLSEESLAFLIRKSEGIPLLIDPVSKVKAVKLKKLLGMRPLFLTPNREELEILAEKESIRTDADLITACDKLHDQDVSTILVGLGKEGAFLSDIREGQLRISPDELDIKDVTGAGDAACAGFIHGLIQKMDLNRIIQFSQRAASLACKSETSIAEGLSHIC